jgi:amidase
MKICFSLLVAKWRNYAVFPLLLLLLSAAEPAVSQQPEPFNWAPFDEAPLLEQLAANDNPRLRFRLINSRHLDKNRLWDPFNQQLADFSELLYNELKPLILEQDIPSLQRAVRAGRLSYENLVKFYLYRIRLFESDNNMALNALIALNPDVVAVARGKDRAVAAGLEVDDYSLFGIPVLLKDNIGTLGMPTTAGAVVMAANSTADAFITRRLRANGAVILGKANLSEWAYYFCEACPLGYSAMGGQTLNPYGRMLIETGGSSSGSAVAVAANYSAVAVGSETSGSILSPASHNALVGLKPTTGLLSRHGVVPISGTLDTVGPIARTVTDAVILFNGMVGYDRMDSLMPLLSVEAGLSPEEADLAGRRIGYVAGLDSEPLFRAALDVLRAAGAEVLETGLPEFTLARFGEFLGAEMKRDLASYLENIAAPAVGVTRVEEIVLFNSVDEESRAPYGQALFDAMVDMEFSADQVVAMRNEIRTVGAEVLGATIDGQQFDVLLSMNNLHASLAAAANFPALTLPMGIRGNGEPAGLTLIAPSFAEQTMVAIGLALERLMVERAAPPGYQ